MRTALCCWLSLLPILATTGSAQYIAYPQDATTGSSANNAILGRNNTGTTDEVHAQIAIPEAFLPSTGGLVTAIEVASNSTVTLPFTSLKITAANQPATTPFPSLNTTFAVNLGASPVTVFNQTAFSLNFTLRQWTRVTFTTPFYYVAGNHLVLDFQKVIGTAATGGPAHYVASDRVPYDLPIMMVAFGALNSGAVNATANTSTGARQPPRLRVFFLNTPTTVLSSQNDWRLGTSVTITTRSSPNAIFAQLLEVASSGLSQRATPLKLPSIAGAGWVLPGPNLVPIVQGTTTTGTTATTLTIPNLPGLSGKVLVCQSVLADPVAGLGWTNAVDARMQ